MVIAVRHRVFLPSVVLYRDGSPNCSRSSTVSSRTTQHSLA